MGKSKKRIFNKNKNMNSITMRREDAVSSIVSDLKNNILDNDTKNLLTLFGISAEELAESGASYEELKALKGII